jgi:beta-N-acetylhexosaminidase
MDNAAGLEAVRMNARLIAATLYDLTININCLPCLDIPQPDSHEFLNGRASGTTVEQSAALGQATCDGLLAGGIMPIIKHIPGHGRATADSHHELPRITAPLEDLQNIDFAPFKALHTAGWAMTAHVVYECLDNERPASTSPLVTQQIIREQIGFDGFLVSDDICMQALSGTMAERFNDCLNAGSDAVLHCNGNLSEMNQIADTGRLMDERAQARFERATAMTHPPQPFDRTAGLDRLSELLDSVGASS